MRYHLKTVVLFADWLMMINVVPPRSMTSASKMMRMKSLCFQSRQPKSFLPFALLVLAFSSSTALAANSPVAISADVSDSDPSIETSDFGGHKAWSIIWRRDGQGRELRIGFIERLELPYRDHLQELVDFAHDEDVGEAVAQTLDLPGRAEQLWNRDVFWLAFVGARGELGSDLIFKAPASLLSPDQFFGNELTTAYIYYT